MADTPLPTSGVTPWDAQLNAAIDSRRATLQAQIDALPGPGTTTLSIPPFTKAGNLTPFVGKNRWYAPTACTLAYVIFSVNTAPLGADLVFDVYVNVFDGGTSIFATQPRIVDSTNFVVSATPAFPAMAQFDYLTVDVVQTGVSGGGTIAGSDLTVQPVSR